MNKNYVVIDLEKYNELIKRVDYLESNIKEIEFEKSLCLEEICELEIDKKFMSDEIRDILDAIVDDNISYAERFSSYDITLSSKIADYLNDNDYLELVKEIKKAKLETKLVNDIKEIKEGAINE